MGASLWLLAPRTSRVARYLAISGLGALIGYSADEDRRRHTVTESGVVVVTIDDEPLIGPLSEEALRFEAEADRRGGGG